MKNVILLLSVLSLFASSCTKECDAFHEGKKCEIEVREKYFGQYYGSQLIQNTNHDVTPFLVVATVTTNASGAQYISIDGMKTEMVDENSFQIPLQQILNGGTAYSATGQGSFEGDHLIFIMSLTQGSEVLTLTFAGSK